MQEKREDSLGHDARADAAAAGSLPKKPWSKPRLVEHGNVVALTRSGTRTDPDGPGRKVKSG
jgi:hypothetical protein